jgi:cyclohexyl-isocyanide hydratase
MSKMQIVIPIFDRVTHLDFTGPHQVLVHTPNAEVVVASVGGKDVVGDGLTFGNLTDLATIERCDMLLVPGGGGTSAAMLDDDFMREIRRLGAGAKYVTSVCTGALVLGAAGFLTGKHATTHWSAREQLAKFGAIVETGRVVRDGDIFTGGGVTAGIDFGLVVLAELAGETYAKSVQLQLEYAPSPPFNSGLPELAEPEVLKMFFDRGVAMREVRIASVAEAARRLQGA